MPCVRASLGWLLACLWPLSRCCEFFVRRFRRSAAEAERGHHEPTEEPVVPPVGVGHAQRGPLLRSESGHVRNRISIPKLKLARGAPKMNTAHGRHRLLENGLERHSLKVGVYSRKTFGDFRREKRTLFEPTYIHHRRTTAASGRIGVLTSHHLISFSNRYR